MAIAIDTTIKRFGEHRNGFGFLRLLFASLVIVSHTPELVDGDRSRELLSKVFHTVSFGEVAVAGFFSISGYLIVGSYQKHPHVRRYLTKRIARIYPGFIVASLLSLLVFAPLGGGSVTTLGTTIGSSLMNLVLLLKPQLQAFPGTFYPDLNGAMWTISIEFRCYLLVLVLGASGLLQRSWIIACLSLVLAAVAETVHSQTWDAIFAHVPLGNLLFADFRGTLRLTSIFLVGSLYFIWRDRIPLTAKGAAVATVALVLCLTKMRLAQTGLAIFGGYLIFAFAKWQSTGPISRVNNRNDISYGVYLYAWPIEKLLLWYVPDAPLVVVGLVTFALACMFGAASWYLIEKPVMRRLRDGRQVSSSRHAEAAS